MSSYVVTGGYNGTFDSGTGIFTVAFPYVSVSPFELQNATDSDIFSPGEVIHILGDPTLFVFYAGHVGSAILVTDNQGGYALYTDDPDHQPGDAILVTIGAALVCFLAGTLLATPMGERAIETLAAGDLVLTTGGETRPVLWIGRQTVVAAFADPLRSYPIRIAAGALSENVPARHLFVSPDHALLLDGVLVQAGALVNGTSITRVERPEERFTYYHIELEDHALVLAATPLGFLHLAPAPRGDRGHFAFCGSIAIRRGVASARPIQGHGRAT
jgi:hypothetical protein